MKNNKTLNFTIRVFLNFESINRSTLDHFNVTEKTILRLERTSLPGFSSNRLDEETMLSLVNVFALLDDPEHRLVDLVVDRIRMLPINLFKLKKRNRF